MLIIAGHLSVDPALRGEYLALTYDVAVRARAFPGCLDFVQAPDPIDPSRIVVYERWETDADLDAFRGSGTDDDRPPRRLPDLRDADVHRYRISAVEAP